jgi:hypothetical protein
MHLHRDPQISDTFVITFPPTWRWDDFRRLAQHLYTELEVTSQRSKILFDMSYIDRIPVGFLTAMRFFIKDAPFDIKQVYVVGKDADINAAYTMIRQVAPDIGKRFMLFHTMDALYNNTLAIVRV